MCGYQKREGGKKAYESTPSERHRKEKHDVTNTAWRFPNEDVNPDVKARPVPACKKSIPPNINHTSHRTFPSYPKPNVLDTRFLLHHARHSRRRSSPRILSRNMQVTNTDVRIRAVHAWVLRHLDEFNRNDAAIDGLARGAADLTVV
jgi:hypothetical protein